MGEADWVLYLVIAVSAGGVVWAVEHTGEKIMSALRSHHLSMHHDVDRVIERLGALEYQLKQVRVELRRSQGLGDGDIL